MSNLTSLPVGGRAQLLSIVVPIFNELDVLPEFFHQLCRAVDRLPLRIEMIFVDDGSQDGSSDWLIGLEREDTRIRLVRLSRNFGKEAAMTAGLAHALGDALILIDADLQDPPEEIPQMVLAWRNGADVVSMQRTSRAGEGWVKRLTAAAFYRLFAHISQIPVPIDTGDFRLLSRRVVEVLLSLPERQRFMKAMFCWPGFRQITLQYKRQPRKAGRSSWSWLRLLGLAMDGVTSYSVAPLRLATLFGALSSIAAFTFAIWILVKTLILGEVVAGFPTIMVCLLTLGGIQLLSIGLLGEYVGRTYIESKQRPLYVIESVSDSSLELPTRQGLRREG